MVELKDPIKFAKELGAKKSADIEKELAALDGEKKEPRKIEKIIIKEEKPEKTEEKPPKPEKKTKREGIRKIIESKEQEKIALIDTDLENGKLDDNWEYYALTFKDIDELTPGDHSKRDRKQAFFDMTIFNDAIEKHHKEAKKKQETELAKTDKEFRKSREDEGEKVREEREEAEFAKLDKEAINPVEVIKPDGKEGEPIIDVSPEDIKELPKNEVALEQNGNEKLAELGRKLEDARRDYLVRDFNMDKASSRLFKFFKLGKRSQLKEFNDEFEGAKTRYELALKNYLAGMAENKVGAREMTEYLYKIENIKREEARDQIRIENSPHTEWLKKSLKEVVDRYRALPWQKKIIYGAALGMVGGFGAGAGLGIAVGGAGGAAIAYGYRAFCAAVSTTGYKAMFEGIAEKKKASKDEGRIENILESSKYKQGEINYEKLLNSLNEKIDKVDQLIQKTKQHQRWRTFAAIGGAGLTFFGGRWVAHQVSDYFHGGGGGIHHPEVKVPAHISDSHTAALNYEDGVNKEMTEARNFNPEIHQEAEITPEVPKSVENPIATVPGGQTVNEVFGIPPEGTEMPTGETPELTDMEKALQADYAPGNIHNQILEVKGEGNGVESTIIEHLKANPDLVDKYNELHGGGKIFNEGEIADRIYQHFEPDEAAKAAGFTHGGPNLVHEGAKISINPETMTIEELDNREHDLGYLHHGGTTVQDNIPPDSHNTGLTPEEINKINDNAQPGQPIEPEIKIEKVNLSGKINELIGSAGDPAQAIGHTIKELSLNDHANWEAMKDMPFSEASRELKPDIREKLSHIYEGYKEIFGQEADPKESLLAGKETVKSWVGRMTNLAIERKK